MGVHVALWPQILSISSKNFYFLPCSPRRQGDHGTMVFHCQPWLTMVDSVVTMMPDHGDSFTADHGSWSTMVKKYHYQVLKDTV